MTVHPLESVSADEVETAVKIFREHHPDEKSFFSSIALKEPDKSDVLGSKKISRVIELTGVDQQADGGFTSLVDVTENKFITTTRLTLDAQVAYNVADLELPSS